MKQKPGFALVLFVFSLMVSFAARTAHAEWDASLGGSYRSYPLGGGAEAEFGYGRVIWGNSSDALYGFFRIAGQVEGVIDHTQAGGYVELFPVSIFGVRAGRLTTQSYLDYDDFDCELYSCRGRRHEGFFEVPLFLAFQRLQFSGSYRRSLWTQAAGAAVTSDEYLEPTSGLNLERGGDEEVARWQTIWLLQMTPSWQVGYLQTQSSVRGGPAASELTTGGRRRQSEMWAGFLRYKWSPGGIEDMLDVSLGGGAAPRRRRFTKIAEAVDWGELTVTVGAGESHSHLLTKDPAWILNVHWQVAPKLGY